VFASTEILARIREGESPENMVKGAFNSIVHRIIELGISVSGDKNLVMTGGVIQFYPYIGELLGEKLGVKINIPPQPQVIGAYGAAIFALDKYHEKSR
jgi:activator of 2-hydroxyglutaryl-CoA dehydratase